MLFVSLNSETSIATLLLVKPVNLELFWYVCNTFIRHIHDANRAFDTGEKVSTERYGGRLGSLFTSQLCFTVQCVVDKASSGEPE